jgi:hypothetical protein
MDPVRVKLYGLFAVTRRGYLTQLTIAGFLLVGLLVLRTYLPPPPAEQKGHLPAVSHWIWWLLNNLPWVVLAFTILYGIEAAVVLRRFAQKEALQRTRPPKGSPKP